jgi:hypothetical protein
MPARGESPLAPTSPLALGTTGSPGGPWWRRATAERVRPAPWPILLGWCVLAAAPLALAVVDDLDDVTMAAMASTVLLGAGSSVALDDRAEVLLAAMPVAVGWRRALRLAATLGALALTASVLVLALRVDGARVTTPSADLLAVAVASATLALAARVLVQDDPGVGSPGAAGAGAAVLTIACLAAAAGRVRWLPQIGDPASTGRWWLVAGLAALVAVATFDDPGRPRRVRRRRPALTPQRNRTPAVATPTGEVRP